MSVNYDAKSGGKKGISFLFFLNMKIYSLFSLDSPHLGDSKEYTQYTIFNLKKKTIIYYNKSAAMGSCPRDSRTSSKQAWSRAISVRAIEVLL